MNTERTIYFVFGPSTAMYWPFLKRCTLTYKAFGTTCISRASSKPLQTRRQGIDPHPVWSLVEASSALWPELATRWMHQSQPNWQYIVIIAGDLIYYLLCKWLIRNAKSSVKSFNFSAYISNVLIINSCDFRLQSPSREGTPGARNVECSSVATDGHSIARSQN